MGKKKIVILAVAIFAMIGLGTFVFAGTDDPEYIVSFDSNYGSYVDNQKVKSGKKAERPEDPNRENYTFDGWYLSLNDETEYDFDKRVFKDITLIAKWKAVEEKAPEQEPTENQPAAENPAQNQPVVNQPVVNQPAQNQPVVNQPVNQDQTRLNDVLNRMTAKNITTSGTSLNYTFDGCTIRNTGNTAPNGVSVTNSTVTTLYRGVSNGTITSNYQVTCGSQTGNKTVNHVIVASPYRYTSNYESALDVYTLRVTDGSNTASDYVIYVGGASIPTGMQIAGSMHNPDNNTPYNMTFNNNRNVTYAVRSAD